MTRFEDEGRTIDITPVIPAAIAARFVSAVLDSLDGRGGQVAVAEAGVELGFWGPCCRGAGDVILVGHCQMLRGHTVLEDPEVGIKLHLPVSENDII